MTHKNRLTRHIAKLVLSWVLITSILTAPLRANADCKGDIVVCDKALQATKKEVQLCDLAVKELRDETDALNASLQSEQHKLEAWYHNPFILVALGMIAGGFLMKR